MCVCRRIHRASSSEYGEDLINRDVVDQELLLWQLKWLAVASKNRPDTLAKAITKCDGKRFPNLFVLFKIACTFPITLQNASVVSLQCVD